MYSDHPPQPLPDPVPEPSPQAAPEPLRRRLTALLVDDEQAVRTMTLALLKGRNINVLTAEGCAEALHIARQKTEPIDVFLLDLSMPGMNGRELRRALLQLRPETKTIYLSGYPDGTLPGEDAPEPGVPFLPKPFISAQLNEKLRELFPGWEPPPVPMPPPTGQEPTAEITAAAEKESTPETDRA